MRQIWRRMAMIHLTIGWRWDDRKRLTNTHTARGFSDLYQMFARKQCILCSALRLPYITLCCIDSRFFLPLEQSRTVLLGCHLAASVLREAARWQLFYFISFFNVNYNKKDLIRSGIFPHLTRTFYIQFSFSFKRRKASLRNLYLNQFTLAF